LKSGVVSQFGTRTYLEVQFRRWEAPRMSCQMNGLCADVAIGGSGRI